MIQRIQSLYLFVITILFVSMVVTPLMDFRKEYYPQRPTLVESGEVVMTSGDTKVVENYVMNYKGIVSEKTGDVVTPTTLVTIYEIIVALIATLTLCLFKNRQLQIKLTLFNLVLQLGFYILMGVYVYTAGKYAGLDWHFRITVAFPLIAAILSYLAFRAITRDELMVRAMDRIR